MVEITNDSLIHEFSSFPFTRLFPVDNSQIVAIKRKPKNKEQERRQNPGTLSLTIIADICGNNCNYVQCSEINKSIFINL